MNRRLDRRAAAIGAFGLAVALAVPAVAVSIAGARPSEAVTHDQVEDGAPRLTEPPATRAIVYGTASETTVTVHRQALPQGTPEVLFSYDNPDTHDQVDNQAINAPELAIAPDGRAVAYFSRSGLRVHHLDTGADEVVIGRSDPQPGGDGYDPPTWTIPELNPPPTEDPKDVYTAAMLSLGDIAFSPDGRFLSFAGYWYEYSDHWVIELATGHHWKDNGSGDLAWSPSSDRVAVAGPSYADPGELAVSTPGEFGHYNRIRPVRRPAADLGYDDVEFAPSGDRIAFAYNEPQPLPAMPVVHLATSNIDGTGFTKVDTGGVTEAFAFGDDGDTLYAVERRGAQFVLVAHDLAGGRSRDVTTVPNVIDTLDLWVTPSGDLAVIGATAESGEGSFRQRLFLYAPDGRPLETSPSFSSFTRLIGLG